MTDILEEAAFRAWAVAWARGDTLEVARSVWNSWGEKGQWLDIAEAALEFAAEVVTGEQPVSLGSDDDAQRAICRRIAAKLTGGSHV